jgi:hypothetical protein
MSCMHDTLLQKILPKSKWKFDKPQELISASGDTMKSLGNLDIGKDDRVKSCWSIKGQIKAPTR